MFHRARFRIAILPIFAPDRHRRPRPSFREKEGGFGSAISAANYQRLFAHVRIGIDEAMMDLRQVFTGTVQSPRVLHRTNREQDRSGSIGSLAFGAVKTAGQRLDRESFIKITANSDNLFARVNPQVVIENEMNVMR